LRRLPSVSANVNGATQEAGRVAGDGPGRGDFVTHHEHAPAFRTKCPL